MSLDVPYVLQEISIIFNKHRFCRNLRTYETFAGTDIAYRYLWCVLDGIRYDHIAGATQIETNVPVSKPTNIANENICSGSAPKKNKHVAPITTMLTV